MNSVPVKYEFDQESQRMRVDRFLTSAMRYPVNYGFIPGTLSGDGDSLDAMVYCTHSIKMNSVICVKPIGVLITKDEGGLDHKILTVPTDAVDCFFRSINCYKQLPKSVINIITHFFQRYKDLDAKKWIEVDSWQSADQANDIISNARMQYTKQKKKV